ncbi:hypothetical protein BGZ96_000145 [Linnemannia gamsii]|uniref:MFS general substrate transporter n=1 Tax=Linnemannia gamsii TaxID=64522 RepID=A0ABQ7JPP0_9FUNG|nr:hypothetical protein BGZ96_000145 [Linnemannia gamsii]
MCPFLYYMVRDFHVGADKWIGYYAGLLLTGFWGANLATTLFWGYLSVGPLAGGGLTKKMIPGFEAFPYFAPCLLASAVGLFITGVVGLVLNETHPTWAKTVELDKILEDLSRFERMGDGALDEADDSNDVIRGRPGYENSRHYREAQAAVSVTSKDVGLMAEAADHQDVVASLSVGATTTTTSLGTRPRLRQTAGVGIITPPLVVCTCHPHDSATVAAPSLPPAYRCFSSITNSNAHPRPLPPPSKLSPATELYLTLTIYTLLVLTSILGNEFVMLYTQSPAVRGGLEFSAKTLGQILTLRGIFKLGFTLCGYPWMVKRTGLLKCLRLGIIAIGVFSVVGLGWFVPWTIFVQQQQEEATRNRASLRTASVDFIGLAGNEGSGSALTFEGGKLPVGAGGGATGGSEKTPVGMGVILLCLSLISMGDVLGYVSVLVLASLVTGGNV